MTLRGPIFLAFVALTAACAGGGTSENGGVLQASAADYTVSYRNKVRLPASDTPLEADAFAAQIKVRDPLEPTRCAGEESEAYRDITQFLGGITWTHPVRILKNEGLPPLYDNPLGVLPMDSVAARAGEGDAAGPTIERPDLVGVKNGVGVFLSKRNGLVAVDARGASPVVSCSMKLPGQPRNFLFHGDELVVIVNGRSPSKPGSALLRYRVADGKFQFIDAVRLEDQTITDARLFDSTIVAYTSWTTNRRHIGQKVIVVQWDDALAVDWQDSLLDAPEKQDPLEGQDPAKKYEPGEVVSQTWTYASFVTASDRYFVVPRAVHRAAFRGYATYDSQVCTNYNPHYEQITSCNVNYEKRLNPDYKAPDPVSGNYSCNGKKLADCVQAAAPVVSQWIYVPVGQTCKPVWLGRCEKYENRRTTYPEYDTSDETELAIYRFENGSFTKLDDTLSKLVEKTDAIAFETSPLVLKGAMTSRDQLQFQNGHLYFYGDRSLQTYAVAGSSLSYLDRLDIHSPMGGGPATIAFSDRRVMISTTAASDSLVNMLDLTEPSKPSWMGWFSMVGRSTQLLLASGGILGPGNVDMPVGGDATRRLEKVTLFSNDDGHELDNLLLGTEYDTLESSYFGPDDDQRIRLSPDRTRVFLPYSGRHHANEKDPVAHRLAIARIESSRLVSERSFEVSDEIIRTASVDEQRSLVFGDSASYAIDRSSGDWKLSTLQEVFVPFATYRLDDRDLYATIGRVGTKCRVTVHAGDAGVFGTAALGSADLACDEHDDPVAIHRSIVFAKTGTGVTISDDGAQLTALDAPSVQGLLESRPKGYCWAEGAAGDGRVVEYLDEVPSRIYCKDER